MNNNIMHVHGDMLRIRCPRCDQPQSGCVCTYDSNIRSAQFNKIQETSGSSPGEDSTADNSVEGGGEDTTTQTPGSPSSSSVTSQVSNNNSTTASITSTTTSSSANTRYNNYTLPPLRLNPHHHSCARQSQLPIPIHDPTDDIDSDTPIYKSEENVVPDRAAVLGPLLHRSSEDLMKEIYSNFTDRKKRRCDDGTYGEEGQIERINEGMSESVQDQHNENGDDDCAQREEGISIYFLYLKV
ncbi:hypothetical protein BDA99DRAFT_174143 [Phascolomyces articulosus]|uniref:Uncharacterized protein n=1 Tax=Phascolomyces articulosus TaxID=60185 RepID=A0AAD5K3K4_9FUNG|nr:hypothetical protein BDA99DRAFT_174143 [Phascolomyces articulosus]